jgi:translation initiation factor 2-alpha kinase 4
LLSLLFERTRPQARAILYDADWSRNDHVRLESVVTDRLAALFRLHGAVDHEPPLFLPAAQPQKEDAGSALFLDRQGDLVALPRNALSPFARLAALANIKRIKRYHIGNVYQFK